MLKLERVLGGVTRKRVRAKRQGCEKIFDAFKNAGGDARQRQRRRVVLPGLAPGVAHNACARQGGEYNPRVGDAVRRDAAEGVGGVGRARRVFNLKIKLRNKLDRARLHRRQSALLLQIRQGVVISNQCEVCTQQKTAPLSQSAHDGE